MMTDMAGSATHAWVPSEVGRFLVQVKLPADFTVSQRVYGSMQLNATV
jgi:hypothetical protein